MGISILTIIVIIVLAFTHENHSILQILIFGLKCPATIWQEPILLLVILVNIFLLIPTRKPERYHHR